MTQTIGEWVWDRRSERLRLSVIERSLAPRLSGEWAVGDLEHIIDGLSRARLKEALASQDGEVAVELALADGLNVQLVGAHLDANSARGLILNTVRSSRRSTEPGPQLLPVFQPIFSLRTQRIAGFEALARWGEAQLAGNAETDEALASNMLIQSAEAISELRAQDGAEELFMHVNLTGLDFMKPGLVDLVSALISGHGLEDGGLRLELTEQAALRDVSRTLETIQDLKEVGARLVLDDFGSGHSSFLWLADLPADSLKIDASLIRQMGNPRVETILEGLTLIARRLGMKTTAEGVEDMAILPRLRNLGFDYAQGFALGRPVPLKQAANFLEG